MQKTTAKKRPWNLSPHPRLKAFVDEFVRLNGRTSATAVIEEALREFFEKRGINTEVPPEELLRAVAEQEDKKDVSEGTGDANVTKQQRSRPSGKKGTEA